MKCEACKKRKAKHADLHLNMWLCTNCYSRFDTPYLSDEKLSTLERKLFLVTGN